MRYKIKSNTGCAHYADEPCNRCWYEAHGRGHFQGQEPPPIISQFMPPFPEDTVFEHAYDPWEKPRPVSSREELREMCLKQGVDSVYLKESMTWKHGEYKWF